jgi:hypothetical protein
MKKITISFPQIVFERRTIEVTEDKHEEILNGCLDEKVEFIWDNMTGLEKQWSQGIEALSSAVDIEYCGVKNES